MTTMNLTLDPTTFEILSHRLWQITYEMAQTMVRVSGSAVTVEARDYMTSLYAAEGDSLVVGAGVTFHGAIGSLGLKHIIDKFSKSPGIFDGNFWLINDTEICSPHQPDCFIFTPIFYKGELVAWSGTMNHMSDIGSIDPGGFCPNAREIFHEGLRIGGINIAEHGEIRRDLEYTLLGMSRDPGMFGLTLRIISMMKVTDDPEILARTFEVRLLSSAGLSPHLDSCVACSSDIGASPRFDVARGGVLCDECKGDSSMTRRGPIIPISRGTVELMKRMQQTPLELIPRLRILETTRRELRKILKSFISFHVDVGRLRSLDFLTSIENDKELSAINR